MQNLKKNTKQCFTVCASFDSYINEIVFQSKADHPQTGYTERRFCSCDLDLNPMTLIYELDLKIVKMYLHIKMNFLGQGYQELEHCRQTQRQMRPHALQRLIRGW